MFLTSISYNWSNAINLGGCAITSALSLRAQLQPHLAHDFYGHIWVTECSTKCCSCCPSREEVSEPFVRLPCYRARQHLADAGLRCRFTLSSPGWTPSDDALRGLDRWAPMASHPDRTSTVVNLTRTQLRNAFASHHEKGEVRSWGSAILRCSPCPMEELYAQRVCKEYISGTYLSFSTLNGSVWKFITGVCRNGTTDSPSRSHEESR